MKPIFTWLAAVLVAAAAVGSRAVFAQESPLDAAMSVKSMDLSNGTTNLVVKLHDAPLDMVLEHLAAAAGCKLVLEAKVTGTVAAFSSQSLSRAEAYNLLNTILIQNGLAAIPEGNSLTIVNRDEAKTRGIPVRFGNDPQAIPRNDELVTQVIPIQFTEAASLVKNVQPLLPRDTIITANESANTIVITDVQASIRRAVEILRAIDLGTEEVISVKVFRLKNADPLELADVLTEVFPSQPKPAMPSRRCSLVSPWDRDKAALASSVVRGEWAVKAEGLPATRQEPVSDFRKAAPLRSLRINEPPPSSSAPPRCSWARSMRWFRSWTAIPPGNKRLSSISSKMAALTR